MSTYAFFDVFISFTVSQLIVNRIYLGHKTEIVESRIFDLLFGSLVKVSIFDSYKIYIRLQRALKAVYNHFLMVYSGFLIFGGINSSIVELINRRLLLFTQPYWSWLLRKVPGTLTNFFYIKNFRFYRFKVTQYIKFKSGVKNGVVRSAFPSFVVVLTAYSHYMLREASFLNLPGLGIFDSNTNFFTSYSYNVPGSDDTFFVQKFYILLIFRAVATAIRSRIGLYFAKLFKHGKSLIALNFEFTKFECKVLRRLINFVPYFTIYFLVAYQGNLLFKIRSFFKSIFSKKGYSQPNVIFYNARNLFKNLKVLPKVALKKNQLLFSRNWRREELKRFKFSLRMFFKPYRLNSYFTTSTFKFLYFKNFSFAYFYKVNFFFLFNCLALIFTSKGYQRKGLKKRGYNNLFLKNIINCNNATRRRLFPLYLRFFYFLGNVFDKLEVKKFNFRLTSYKLLTYLFLGFYRLRRWYKKFYLFFKHQTSIVKFSQTFGEFYDATMDLVKKNKDLRLKILKFNFFHLVKFPFGLLRGFKFSVSLFARFLFSIKNRRNVAIYHFLVNYNGVKNDLQEDIQRLRRASVADFFTRTLNLVIEDRKRRGRTGPI